MSHVTPKAREQMSAIEPVLAASEAVMGFVPNSMMTMAHMPQMTMAFSMLAGVVFGADLKQMMSTYESIVPAHDGSENLAPELVQLIAYSVSVSAGCQYCQAHTSHNAHRAGASEEKLQQILNFESADIFTEAERAVISLALAAGQVPNESSEGQFVALREHFSERQVVQVVGVISLFGFLNRWNDTMATELEALPKQFAAQALSGGGWSVGKHEG